MLVCNTTTALSLSPPHLINCLPCSSVPWESAFSGEEVCPSWAATGLREIHINGDIAFALAQFWRATKDNSGGWLNATAWPLLSGIAEFWSSKLAIDNPGAAPGSPLSLKNVIPPDEYADHVDDSAFTNAGAIITLQRAAEVAQILGKPQETYLPWLDAASRVVIPFDSEQFFTPEYAGYKRGTVVKQADAILLGFPLQWPLSTNVQAANLAYYSTVTDSGGPAMTWAMFAIGYIELGAGFEAIAASNYNRSFANAQEPFLVWTETPGGGTPNFLTGAGGWLQAAFFGYTGLRISDSNLTLSPATPELTSKLGLRGISYLGNRLDVRVDYSVKTIEVTVQALPPPSPIDAAGADSSVDPLALAPLYPASRRSQRGRVVLGAGRHVIVQRELELVDAAGAPHSLVPGVPISLALQAVTVREVS